MDRHAVRLEIDFTVVAPLNHWLSFVKRLSVPQHCIALAMQEAGAGLYACQFMRSCRHPIAALR